MSAARLSAAVRARTWAVLLLAALLVLAVAQAAVLLLEPRGGVVAPDDVRAAAYFTAEQIARAEAFRGPQIPILLAQTVLGIVVLALVVGRPPRLLQGGAGSGRRFYARVALTAAGLAVLLAVVAIPLRIVGRIRGLDVGLITRSWGGWVVDVLLQAAIQAGLWAVAGVALVALMRRFPRRWWVAGSGFVAAAAVVLVFATPLVIDPLFNRFTPLTGPLRGDVERLAERAGVDVGEVYVMDASRRTTAANAYVTGLGHSKRVVLYDTLIDRYPRDEVRFVVAHELAHQREHDVRGAVLYVVLVGPVCLLAIAVAVRRLAPGGPGGRRAVAAGGPGGGGPDDPATGTTDGAGPGDAATGTTDGSGPRDAATGAAGDGPVGAARGGAPDPRLVPALALVLAIVAPTVTSVSNQLSRRVEARADTVALELTDDPDALVGFRRRSTVRNVAEPDPGRLGQVLFGTHPTSVERIGAAEAWRRGVRP